VGAKDGKTVVRLDPAIVARLDRLRDQLAAERPGVMVFREDATLAAVLAGLPVEEARLAARRG